MLFRILPRWFLSFSVLFAYSLSLVVYDVSMMETRVSAKSTTATPPSIAATTGKTIVIAPFPQKLCALFGRDPSRCKPIVILLPFIIHIS